MNNSKKFEKSFKIATGYEEYSFRLCNINSKKIAVFIITQNNKSIFKIEKNIGKNNTDVIEEVYKVNSNNTILSLYYDGEIHSECFCFCINSKYKDLEIIQFNPSKTPLKFRKTTIDFPDSFIKSDLLFSISSPKVLVDLMQMLHFFPNENKIYNVELITNGYFFKYRTEKILENNNVEKIVKVNNSDFVHFEKLNNNNYKIFQTNINNNIKNLISTSVIDDKITHISYINSILCLITNKRKCLYFQMNTMKLLSSFNISSDIGGIIPFGEKFNNIEYDFLITIPSESIICGLKENGYKIILGKKNESSWIDGILDHCRFMMPLSLCINIDKTQIYIIDYSKKYKKAIIRCVDLITRKSTHVFGSLDKGDYIKINTSIAVSIESYLQGNFLYCTETLNNYSKISRFDLQSKNRTQFFLPKNIDNFFVLNQSIIYLINGDVIKYSPKINSFVLQENFGKIVDYCIYEFSSSKKIFLTTINPNRLYICTLVNDIFEYVVSEIHPLSFVPTNGLLYNGSGFLIGDIKGKVRLFTHNKQELNEIENNEFPLKLLATNGFYIDSYLNHIFIYSYSSNKLVYIYNLNTSNKQITEIYDNVVEHRPDYYGKYKPFEIMPNNKGYPEIYIKNINYIRKLKYKH